MFTKGAEVRYTGRGERYGEDKAGGIGATGVITQDFPEGAYSRVLWKNGNSWAVYNRDIEVIVALEPDETEAYFV